MDGEGNNSPPQVYGLREKKDIKYLESSDSSNTPPTDYTNAVFRTKVLTYYHLIVNARI